MYKYKSIGSIRTNKASGGDGIPVELFQILKDDAVKMLHSTCQQVWKTQQWPQDWKMSVFIPIPKKGNASRAIQNPQMILLQCCTQGQQIRTGNLETAVATGKDQSSSQFPRRAALKNVQTTGQLVALTSHSSKMLLKILQARF